MKREKQTTSLNKLIIKVKEGERIQKNIGRIFRKYNIIEYKEPGETLTINDFYKGYGNGCFYLSNIDLESDIQPKELTITFISNSYPDKMIRHLKNFRKLEVELMEPGIYYVTGDVIIFQIIVINELDSQEQKIEVIVPKDTWSINSSFFGGLFESSIINLKEDGFRKKYIFKFDDGAALSEELQHNIDEGIYESLKDI